MSTEADEKDDRTDTSAIDPMSVVDAMLVAGGGKPMPPDDPERLRTDETLVVFVRFTNDGR